MRKNIARKGRKAKGGKGGQMPTPFNKNAQQCTATSKRSRKRCQNPAVKGWRVCRMHGAGGGRPRERIIKEKWYVRDGRLHHRIEIEQLRKK
jgi:hypothetical protein